MKNRFWSLIFLDFLRPHTTFATYIEAPSRCKWLKDVEGACVGVKTCHDGSLYYEQKHIYTLCTPMSIFDCLPLDCKLGMNAEFHLRRLCIWYAKMACPVCTAIPWHLFAPAKH